MFKFENLEVWKKSIKFNNKIFEITRSLPREYQYSIGSNLIRASVSISNNIAEGSGRKSDKDSSNFYNFAKGSVYEVINVIITLKEIEILNESQYSELYKDSEELAKMLSGLIRSNEN